MLHSVAAFHLQPAGSSELEEKLPKTPVLNELAESSPLRSAESGGGNYFALS
jgi:hypothetical protein